MIGGEAKLGKTFNLLSYASALAMGENLYGNPDWYIPEVARVLYMDGEVGELIMQKRGTKIFSGTNLQYFSDNLWILCKNPDYKLDSGLDKIIKVIEEVQPNVIIFDPLANFHSKDENSAQDMMFIFNQIKKIQDRFKDLDLSVVVCHHYGKPPQGAYADGVDRLSPNTFRGSSAIFGAADTLHTIIKTKEYSRVNPSTGQTEQSWQMMNRFTLRASECPRDFYTQFNFDFDTRVKFENYKGQSPPGKVLNKFKSKPTAVVDSSAGVAVLAGPGEQSNLELIELLDPPSEP